MFERRSEAIREMLGQGAAPIAHGQLDVAWTEHENTGQSLADVVVGQGLLTRTALLERVSQHLGLEYAAEWEAALPPEVVTAVAPEQARTYGVMPCRKTPCGLDLLAVDPFDQQAVDDLSFSLGRPVRLVVGDPDMVAALVRRHYGERGDQADGDLTGLAAEAGRGEAEAVSAADLEALAGQAPIIRFVNLVLAQAIRDQASDIHFEPFEHEFKIRYRIDGALYEMTPPPRTLALPIISRLKVLAGLNIAERRVAQDGRIKLARGGRTVDLRISTLPTQFGESVVLRVLDQAAVQLDLAQLGLPAEVRTGLEEIVHRPNGILVVTGPTGSGKTTTLYSGLRAINSPGLKLLTAEDPVEFEIDGIMQVPVNPSIGLNFAAALRAFLRQDPDVIMVGEIRDLETAQVAVQASLTGHLVLSTLHTNDAVGAVTRLIDLGVEPFLIASTLEAVLAQRLVRRICPQCRTSYQPDEALLRAAGIDQAVVGDRPFYRGAGCAHCHQAGYLGRQGLFEWLRLTEPIRELILGRASTQELRQQARAQGMRTLRDDGLRAVLAGTTSLEEVLKYT